MHYLLKIKRYLPWIIFAVLLLAHVFFLTYQFTSRAPFFWDQVDNAWVAKNMIVNHEFPLVGMQARQGTGIYIGPAYYYIVSFFYFLFNLDPIASPVVALLTGIATFLTIFFVAKKIFHMKVALFTTCIYTFSSYAIFADKVQWPVAFIPLISALMFYALFKVITRNEKFLLLLFFVLGFSFHIHFTSIFYLPILLLCLPLFPRTKKTLLYLLPSLFIFLLWMSPMIASVLLDKTRHTNNIFTFLQGSSNGFHLRRVIQIAPDAFSEFSSILSLPFSSFYIYFLPILFGIALYFQTKIKESSKLIYLVLLWIIIPWFGLATYKGELSNYFFTITRPIALFIIGYLLTRLFDWRVLIGKFLVIVYLVYFFWTNIQTFKQFKVQGLQYYETREYKEFKASKGNEFLYGSPESYLYYFYGYKYYKK